MLAAGAFVVSMVLIAAYVFRPRRKPVKPTPKAYPEVGRYQPDSRAVIEFNTVTSRYRVKLQFWEFGVWGTTATEEFATRERAELRYDQIRANAERDYQAYLASKAWVRL